MPSNRATRGVHLLNASGEVVGVAFAQNTLDGAGLAIPVSTLRSFLSAPGTNTPGSVLTRGAPEAPATLEIAATLEPRATLASVTRGNTGNT